MALYRVTLQVEILVDINEDNLVPKAGVGFQGPGFQGDIPQVAVNRAIWCLMNGDGATRKAFGIKRQNYRKKHLQAEVVESASQWLVTEPGEPAT